MELLPTSTLEELMNHFGFEFIYSFLTLMIPHHQTGIQMARQAHKMFADKRIKDEATLIIQSQERQVSQMKEWLRDWVKDSYLNYDVVLSDLALIMHLSPIDTELQFVVEMIEHHQISNQMARLLLQRVNDEEFPHAAPLLRGLAEEILDSQYSQIKRFINMLKAHGY